MLRPQPNFELPLHTLLARAPDQLGGPVKWIDGQKYIEILRIHETASIVCRATSQREHMYLWIHPDTNGVPSNQGGSCLPCQSLCKLQLNRPRFTCLFCRIRRRLIGKIPALIPIAIFFIYRREDSPNWPWRNFLLKKLMTLCEFLANL